MKEEDGAPSRLKENALLSAFSADRLLEHGRGGLSRGPGEDHDLVREQRRGKHRDKIGQRNLSRSRGLEEDVGSGEQPRPRSARSGRKRRRDRNKPTRSYKELPTLRPAARKLRRTRSSSPSRTSSKNLLYSLKVTPSDEISFALQKGRPSMATILLHNLSTTDYYAFSIKTSNPARYAATPSLGLVGPSGKASITILVPTPVVSELLDDVEERKRAGMEEGQLHQEEEQAQKAAGSEAARVAASLTSMVDAEAATDKFLVMWAVVDNADYSTEKEMKDLSSLWETTKWRKKTQRMKLTVKHHEMAEISDSSSDDEDDEAREETEKKERTGNFSKEEEMTTTPPMTPPGRLAISLAASSGISAFPRSPLTPHSATFKSSGAEWAADDEVSDDTTFLDLEDEEGDNDEIDQKNPTVGSHVFEGRAGKSDDAMAKASSWIGRLGKKVGEDGIQTFAVENDRAVAPVTSTMAAKATTAGVEKIEQQVRPDNSVNARKLRREKKRQKAAQSEAQATDVVVVGGNGDEHSSGNDSIKSGDEVSGSSTVGKMHQKKSKRKRINKKAKRRIKRLNPLVGNLSIKTKLESEGVSSPREVPTKSLLASFERAQKKYKPASPGGKMPQSWIGPLDGKAAQRLKGTSNLHNAMTPRGKNVSSMPAWTKERLIGQGTHGKVYLVRVLESGMPMAMKEIECAPRVRDDVLGRNTKSSRAKRRPSWMKGELTSPKARSPKHSPKSRRSEISVGDKQSSAIDAALKEINILCAAKHENVVEYLGGERQTVGDICFLRIFMQYVDGGSLAGHIKAHGPLPEEKVQPFTKQMLSGLDSLHRSGIAHCDIKCANLLVDSSFSVIKLCDFGTAVAFTADLKGGRREELSSASSLSSLSNNERLQSLGTPLWMAPEVIRSMPSDSKSWQKADIWSVGCTLIEMVTGKTPWPQCSNPLTAMYKIAFEEDRIPEIPGNGMLSEPGQDVLRRCLHRIPQQRPEVEAILAHVWFHMSFSSSGSLLNADGAMQHRVTEIATPKAMVRPTETPLHSPVRVIDMEFEEIDNDSAALVKSFENLSLKDKLKMHRELTNTVSSTAADVKEIRDGLRKQEAWGSAGGADNGDGSYAGDESKPSLVAQEMPKMTASATDALTPMPSTTRNTAWDFEEDEVRDALVSSGVTERAQTDQRLDKRMIILGEKLDQLLRQAGGKFASGITSSTRFAAPQMSQEWMESNERRGYDFNAREQRISDGSIQAGASSGSPKALLDDVLATESSLHENLLYLASANSLRDCLISPMYATARCQEARDAAKEVPSALTSRAMILMWLHAARARRARKQETLDRDVPTCYVNALAGALRKIDAGDSLESKKKDGRFTDGEAPAAGARKERCRLLAYAHARDLEQRLCTVSIIRGQGRFIVEMHQEISQQMQFRQERCRTILSEAQQVGDTTKGSLTKLKLHRRALERSMRELEGQKERLVTFDHGPRRDMQELFSHALNVVEDECTEIENALESDGQYDLAARQMGEDGDVAYATESGFYYEGAETYGAYYDGEDCSTYYDEHGNLGYYDHGAISEQQQEYHDGVWHNAYQQSDHDAGWYYDETHGGWLYDYSYATQNTWEEERHETAVQEEARYEDYQIEQHELPLKATTTWAGQVQEIGYDHGQYQDQGVVQDLEYDHEQEQKQSQGLDQGQKEDGSLPTEITVSSVVSPTQPYALEVMDASGYAADTDATFVSPETPTPRTPGRMSDHGSLSARSRMSDAPSFFEAISNSSGTGTSPAFESPRTGRLDERASGEVEGVVEVAENSPQAATPGSAGSSTPGGYSTDDQSHESWLPGSSGYAGGTKAVVGELIVKSLADYVANLEEGEVNLKEGDEIRVRYKDASGWWEGEIVSSAGDASNVGSYGWFPSNYVQQKFDLFTITESEYDYASPRTARSAVAWAATGGEGFGAGADSYADGSGALSALNEDGEDESYAVVGNTTTEV